MSNDIERNRHFIEEGISFSPSIELGFSAEEISKSSVPDYFLEAHNTISLQLKAQGFNQTSRLYWSEAARRLFDEPFSTSSEATFAVIYGEAMAMAKRAEVQDDKKV